MLGRGLVLEGEIISVKISAMLRVLGGLRTQPFGLPRLATPLGHMSNHVTLPRTTWSVRSQAFYLTGDSFSSYH